jgi:hypothetical protein
MARLADPVDVELVSQHSPSSSTCSSSGTSNSSAPVPPGSMPCLRLLQLGSGFSFWISVLVSDFTSVSDSPSGCRGSRISFARVELPVFRRFPNGADLDFSLFRCFPKFRLLPGLRLFDVPAFPDVSVFSVTSTLLEQEGWHLALHSFLAIAILTLPTRPLDPPGHWAPWLIHYV